MFDSARQKLPEADYICIVKSLYSERWALLIGALTTIAAAAATYLHTGAGILAWFVVLFVIMTVIRYALGTAFDRALARGMQASEADRWEAWLTIATSVLAFIYGMWSFVSIVYVENPFAAYLSTAVSIAVMIGLTTRSFAADRLVTISSAALTVPLATGLVLKGELYYAVASICLLPFMFSYRKLAGDVRKIFISAVEGRMEATRLAEELDSALSTMAHGVCMIDGEGRVLVINDQARKMLRIDSASEVIGRPATDLVFISVSKRIVSTATAQMLLAALNEHDSSKLVIDLADGTHIEVTSTSQNGHTVIMLADITERVLAEARINVMARYDTLTQLPNRTFFTEQAHARLRELAAWDVESPVMIAMIDIDDFKHINDTLGHPVGDRLIRQVAERLSGLFGDSALLSRFGGDEFVVFRTGDVTAALAEEDAAAISGALRVPFNLDTDEWTVTASIGVVVADGSSVDLGELLTRADLALHDAKAAGKARWAMFHDQMDVEYRQRQQLKTQFQHAVEKGQLFLTYQPIVDIRTQTLVGCEALVRWRHPELGIVSPALFIPLAEETGAITALSRFVLAEATRKCLAWPEHMSVSVNLSANDFRVTSVEQMVAEALETANLPAERLIVEVTETALIEEPDKVSQALAALRDMGVGTALDDFGTGYSSLGYLTTMSFSKLKIDRTFTRDIATDERARRLLISVARLSHALDMSVTVEGVETEEQLRVIFEDTDIVHAQGFLFGPPLAAKDADELIARMSGPSVKFDWSSKKTGTTGI